MTSDNIATYDDEKKKLLDKSLDLFKNGKASVYNTTGNLIKVKYKLRDEEHSFTYNIDKGELSNER